MLSCSYRGQTFLAHREGVHTTLSGMNFLRTLSRKPCRAALLTLARACGDHVTRLMHSGCRAKVGSDVFLKHMGELPSITLAVRAGGKQLRMSRYKRWLSSRGLSTVLSWPVHGVRCMCLCTAGFVRACWVPRLLRSRSRRTELYTGSFA